MEPDPGPVRRRRREELRRRHQVRRRRGMALAGVVVLVGAAAAGSAITTGDDSPGDPKTASGSSVATQDTATAAAALGATGQTPTGTTSTTPAALGDVVIGWAGDTVPASATIALPSDPSILLSGVKDALSSPDVTLVNLEGTLTEGGDSKCGPGSTDCFAFRSPPSYASLFKKAGIDVVNQANNHAFDFGQSGYADTRRAIRKVGLRATGGPKDVTVIEREGVKIAFVGFASYSWSGSLNDPAGVQALVERAAQRADLVVAAFHGGAEGSGAQHVPRGGETYLGEDRGDLRRFARAAITAGADLVVGSGPHVVRGMEFYKGRLIAYSAGNFVGYGGVFGLSGPTAVSYVLHVRLRSDGRFRSAKMIPTLLTGQGIAEHDSSRQAIGLVRSLTAADFPTSGARIAENGAIRPPT
jgi:poly-gamma-glutamate capsule biosynthesis protein CapA/YwtB (metallophosphatase superfamily)